LRYWREEENRLRTGFKRKRKKIGPARRGGELVLLFECPRRAARHESSDPWRSEKKQGKKKMVQREGVIPPLRKNEGVDEFGAPIGGPGIGLQKL